MEPLHNAIERGISVVDIWPEEFSIFQGMTTDRVALMVRHESVLARLEEALKDNNSLQHVMMDQAEQVHMQGSSMSSLPATPCSL